MMCSNPSGCVRVRLCHNIYDAKRQMTFWHCLARYLALRRADRALGAGGDRRIVLVTDSKSPHAAPLVYTVSEWREFTGQVLEGLYDFGRQGHAPAAPAGRLHDPRARRRARRVS